uniref:Uncharacterized protein n=1 Tax=Rhizophora mucronata TaxID=61149 RepID=A0A2P2NS90_RHIMU
MVHFSFLVYLQVSPFLYFVAIVSGDVVGSMSYYPVIDAKWLSLVNMYNNNFLF